MTRSLCSCRSFVTHNNRQGPRGESGAARPLPVYDVAMPAPGPKFLTVTVATALAAALLVLPCTTASATEIGVEQDRFTLDGNPTFLLGCSYYAGLGASDETLRRDLEELK